MVYLLEFLSRASQFLDDKELRLLTSQLPQKGVKKMVMICSRFDDGLADTIFDADSIDEAISMTAQSLKKRAAAVIKGQNLSPRTCRCSGAVQRADFHFGNVLEYVTKILFGV